MIDLFDALALIEQHVRPLAPRRMRLVDACGRRLAAAVVSDVDSPPWDRAMMDGFAVRSEDFLGYGAEGIETVTLDIVVDVAAGDVTTLNIQPGSCARIMTGAPIPKGVDAVVPIECAVGETGRLHSGQQVRLRDKKFRAGQHVAKQGAAFCRGQAVLGPGTMLGSAEVGLAAEAGATHVVASAGILVAILSTGSELVPPDARPAFGQTRNSNGPMIAAAVMLLGAEPISLGIGPDRPEAIRSLVAQGLAADVIVLSGGVSAGDHDLVPEIFERCGVEKIFHKVRLKPGKPVWFGVFKRNQAPATIVFGLPGNPASSLVCFELFVRPAMAMLAGKPREEWHLPREHARLTRPTQAAPDRPAYLPCHLVSTGGTLSATPLPWTGSGDLLGFVGANGFLALPAGAKQYAVGDEVSVLLRDSR